VRIDLPFISPSYSISQINDLLRSMLDMHRAENKMISLNWAPVDILKDVFEPVKAVLYIRGNKIAVEVDCPANLVVVSDRLRLKQIVLNLASNSSKFVEKGFIRLRATVDGGKVKLYVEDSGPGIPQDKRDHLFVKFQDSLDLMNQGTGIGLSLCKHIAVLLNGDIWMDNGYDSGIQGYRGTRFVLDLNTPPVSCDEGLPRSRGSSFSSDTGEMQQSTERMSSSNGSAETPLPDKMSVLFVDDDMMVRKMFLRSVLRAFPGWTLSEAASGEAAIQVLASRDFDLVFVDQVRHCCA